MLLAHLFCFCHSSPDGSFRRISLILSSSNATLSANKPVSLRYSSHPLFVGISRSAFCALNLQKTVFQKSRASIVFGDFKKLSVQNCVFSQATTPINIDKNSIYSSTVTERREISGSDIIYFCKFVLCGNEDEVEGGAIRISNGFIMMAKCLFDNCNSHLGGAIYFQRSSCQMKYVHFSECDGISKGGALYINESDITMDMCAFANCQSDFGGAIFADCYSDLKITNGTVFNNTAHHDGAAIYQNYGKLACTTVFFTSNKCSHGAALSLHNATLEFDTVHFMGNMKDKKENPIHITGDESISMKIVCFPKSFELPKVLQRFNGTDQIYHNQVCPSLEDSLEDAIEVDTLRLEVPNSMNSTAFIVSLSSIILLPVIVISLLPYICSGGAVPEN